MGQGTPFSCTHRVPHEALLEILELRGATVTGDDVRYTMYPQTGRGAVFEIVMKVEAAGELTRLKGEVLPQQLPKALFAVLLLPTIGGVSLLIFAFIRSGNATAAQLKPFIPFVVVPIIFSLMAKVISQANQQQALERLHIWFDEVAEAARERHALQRAAAELKA